MGEFLKGVACSGTDCYSWILVLFNILAVFYLVFCSFWKVTRAARITGWVWIAGLLCATVGVLIAHTCIYTLLVTVFTAMMIMAILAIILPQPDADRGEEGEEKQVRLGSYVISDTDDGRYVFAIHDAQRRLVVRSKYSYATVDEAKRESRVCRYNGTVAAISDKTDAWIKEEYYPTFEIYARDGKYHFCLKINGEYVIFNSESYGDIRACERMLEKTKALVASTAVYINTEKVSGTDYERFDEPVIEEAGAEELAAAHATETPVPADEVVEELAAESVFVDEADASEAEYDVAGGVIFTADKKTLWDKYAELSEEQKDYFDRISEYASQKESIKNIEAKNYLTFKYMRDKLVRLRIRRDMVEAVFMLVGSTFKNAFLEGDVKVREAATVIRVENEACLDVVLTTIDMEYEALTEERERRKEEQKAKRRKAKKADLEADNNTATDIAEAEEAEDS